MLYILKNQNRIPRELPVVIDSPMAASVTDILLKYADTYTTFGQNEWRKIM